MSELTGHFVSAGIIVVSPQFNTLTLIQNFVRVSDDNTPWLTLFPIGLQLDPRTGYIVLNGRVGQVQFYSPHDRTFFNVSYTVVFIDFKY